MPNRATSLVILVTPVAFLSGVLYLHAYWWTFGIVIFDYLSVGSYVSYSILPALSCALLVIAWAPAIAFCRASRTTRFGLIGFISIVVWLSVYALINGLFFLWLLLPLVGGPIAGWGLESLARRLNVADAIYPDRRGREVLSLSVSIVLLASAAIGGLRAESIRARVSYQTVRALSPSEKGDSNVLRGTWVLLGTAEKLLFLQNLAGDSTVVASLDDVTPYLIGQHTAPSACLGPLRRWCRNRPLK
jgi:hypothetical protein